jgi:Holliday junction resolvase RusA-like endonuclease
MLLFTVPGRAVPYKRVGAGGHVPDVERRWRKTVADYALQARLADRGWSWTEADTFELELRFHRVPAVGTRKGGDGSNLLKPVEDALSKLLYADDRQIRRLVVEIVDADPGRERVDVVLARRARQ